MPVSIRPIETVVPATVLPQPAVGDLFAAQPGLSRLRQRMVATVFDASAIESRHTPLAELAGDGSVGAGFLDSTGAFRPLPTGRRNAVYREAAGELFVTAAKQALDAAADFCRADPDALRPLLGPGGDGHPGVDSWAVHPGGRSIPDRVEAALELGPEQRAPSREVLRRFGTMSSAAVLFVLSSLLQAPAAGAGRVCALAFGPGLSVESALLTRRDAA